MLALLSGYCWTASALPAPAGTAAKPVESAVDEKALARRVASAHARALAAQDKAKKAADAVASLAEQNKPLRAALSTQDADLAKHTRAAQSAYPVRSAPPKPSKKPSPLPKLESLKTAKTEYEAAVQASRAASKTQIALRRNEEQLELEVEAAEDSAAIAKSAAEEAQGNAALLATQAKRATATTASKSATDVAQAQLKEAKAAALSAGSAATKARSSSGSPSKAGYAKKKADAAREDEKAKQQLATLEVTLREADSALATQNPAVPNCDLAKVPWQNMTYPWFPFGSQGHPLTLKDNVRVCDEPNPDECYGPPNIASSLADQPGPLLGDLDGDGKPEAVLELATFCCDVSGYEMLFFQLDPQCHLRYLGGVSEIANAQGAIVNGAYVVDMPWARPGENLGLGAVSGVEHAEWRLVKGQIKKTVSVKKVKPPQ